MREFNKKRSRHNLKLASHFFVQGSHGASWSQGCLVGVPLSRIIPFFILFSICFLWTLELWGYHILYNASLKPRLFSCLFALLLGTWEEFFRRAGTTSILFFWSENSSKVGKWSKDVFDPFLDFYLNIELDIEVEVESNWSASRSNHFDIEVELWEPWQGSIESRSRSRSNRIESNRTDLTSRSNVFGFWHRTFIVYQNLKCGGQQCDQNYPLPKKERCTNNGVFLIHNCFSTGAKKHLLFVRTPVLSPLAGKHFAGSSFFFFCEWSWSFFPCERWGQPEPTRRRN